jgi:hypothetical protein
VTIVRRCVGRLVRSTAVQQMNDAATTRVLVHQLLPSLVSMTERRFILLVLATAFAAATLLRRTDAVAEAPEAAGGTVNGQSSTHNSVVPTAWNIPSYGSPYATPEVPSCSQPDGAPLFASPQPLIQPAPPIQYVPLVPLPEAASPRPGALPAPTFVSPNGAGPTVLTPPAGPLADIAPGGMVSPQFGLPAGPEVPTGPANPILVPVTDDELVWEQIVDVVTDYFPIAREQQARRGYDAWAEGLIETQYQSGATWLEPMRHDSVGFFNRWESTFQTIRRRATIHVVPDPGGYQVEVIVSKELEDLPHPEHASAAVAAFPNDGSLPSKRTGGVSRIHSSPRWIPLGRDPALEARMLAEIHARVTGVTTDSSPLLFFN